MVQKSVQNDVQQNVVGSTQPPAQQDSRNKDVDSAPPPRPPPAKKLIGIAGLSAALFGLAGCMGFDAISNEARPGGTVLVAVDAVRHQMPDPARVQATFFDHDGAEHTVSLRHMLRVQPDPVSGFGLGAARTNKGLYAGQKLAIIDLIDPETLLPPASPSIASGEGLLELYMPDLEFSSVHALKIIPSSALPGAPSNDFRVLQRPEKIQPLHSGWLTHASPLPHVRVQTVVSDLFDASNAVAGAVFRLRYQKEDFSPSGTAPGFAVTKLSSDPNLQLSWKARDSDTDSVGELIITLRNPHGFSKPDEELYAARSISLFDDLSSVAIGWVKERYLGTGDLPFAWASPPLYFDLHGNLIDGLSATMLNGRAPAVEEGLAANGSSS